MKGGNKIMRFQDKVVVVTGGASGIGRACIDAFSKEGAKVVIADMNPEGQAFADQLTASGRDALFIKTNVTVEEDVINLVDQTVNTFGRLDIMCANAGIGSADGPLADITKAQWDLTIGVNLTGVFLSDKYAIIQMLKQGGGVIVNTGSVHSIVGQVGITAYCAAKGGVRLLSTTGALCYAKDNIRINTVCPGYIRTPLLDKADEATRQYWEDLHPIGRMGTAEEVAHAMLFLASDDASFVSGAILTVDGGYAAK